MNALFDAGFVMPLLGIIWMDLLLSGDNAVVIALVCKNLPEHQQRQGMIYGTAAAVVLRIVGAAFAGYLMALPGLSVAAGLYLLYVSVKLITDAGHAEDAPEAKTTLRAAITTIALADIGMSLDNVMAVAGMAHGSTTLMAIGIIISIPMMIVGASLISGIIGRYPWLVWAGAGLLAWVAGGIIMHDPLTQFAARPEGLGLATSICSMLFVLGLAGLIVLWRPAADGDHATPLT